MGDAMRTWLGTRRDVPALTEGRDVMLALGPSSFIYARVTDDQTVVVAVNASQTPMTVQVPDAEWRNLKTGAVLRVPVGAPGVTA